MRLIKVRITQIPRILQSIIAMKENCKLFCFGTSTTLSEIRETCANLREINRRILVSIAAVVVATTSVAAQTQPATVILVRHAEKAAEPAGDPPLSQIGRARAQALLEVVRDAGLNVIYSTPRLRNLETARTVANALQVPIIEVPIESGKLDAYASEIVRRIKKQGGGRVSLVVGHSNTFAPVVKAFGGPFIEEIADERYDDAFVLTVQDGKPVKMLRLKYGRR